MFLPADGTCGIDDCDGNMTAMLKPYPDCTPSDISAVDPVSAMISYVGKIPRAPPLPSELLALREQLSAHGHDLWVASMKREGWLFGVDFDAITKRQPLLVPYTSLESAARRGVNAAALHISQLRRESTTFVCTLIALGYEIQPITTTVSGESGVTKHDGAGFVGSATDSASTKSESAPTPGDSVMIMDGKCCADLLSSSHHRFGRASRNARHGRDTYVPNPVNTGDMEIPDHIARCMKDTGSVVSRSLRSVRCSIEYINGLFFDECGSVPFDDLSAEDYREALEASRCDEHSLIPPHDCATSNFSTTVLLSISAMPSKKTFIHPCIIVTGISSV